MRIPGRPLLGVVAGALALAAAFPKPDIHLLVWVALVPLLVAAQNVGPWTALRYGLIYGFVYRAAGLYWVVYAMIEHGGLAPPVAILATALLAAYLAIYWGLFALVANGVGISGARAWLLLAATWTGLEYFQSWFLTGFPWLSLGYAAGRTDLMIQLADLAGVYGLSFLAVFVGSALAAVACDRRTTGSAMAFAGALLVAAAAYGGFRLSTATPGSETLRVGLVQGNVAQDSKWDAVLRGQILDRHLQLSRRAAERGAELVLWPESSWPDPYGLERDAEAYERVARVATDSGIGLLVGTVRLEPREEHYEVANAAVLLDRAGAVAETYEKTHLVPFGEYLPFQSVLRRLGPLVQAVGSLRPGAAYQPLLGPRAGFAPFGLSICYEVIFPGIAREQVRRGAQFLATITNDAWYGTTAGPYQHFAMARMRAVENRRWLVRAANTGISGAVDPWGRVVAATELEREDVLVVDVGLRSGAAPYQRAGDLFAVLCQLLALGTVGRAMAGPRVGRTFAPPPRG